MRAKPQFVLCMIGLVGAGKSTVLRKLIERLPMAVVSGDEVRRMIFEKGLPAQPSETIATINAGVAERLAHEGYRLAYDNDSGNAKIRTMRSRRNERLGISEIWVRVAPPESFIIDKLRRYNHTYLFKDADEAVRDYSARKQLHEAGKDALERLPYVYTFDTSRADLDEQAEAAVRKINARLESLTKGGGA